jgi:hypothetical protein
VAGTAQSPFTKKDPPRHRRANTRRAPDQRACGGGAGSRAASSQVVGPETCRRRAVLGSRAGRRQRFGDRRRGRLGPGGDDCAGRGCHRGGRQRRGRPGPDLADSNSGSGGAGCAPRVRCAVEARPPAGRAAVDRGGHLSGPHAARAPRSA